MLARTIHLMLVDRGQVAMLLKDDTIIAGFLENEPGSVGLLASWARSVALHRAWGFETPEDIVQATLLALVQIFREGRFTGGDLRAYVRRVAKNLCVSSYRKARVRRIHVPLEETSAAASAVADRSSDPERTALLRRVLGLLDEANRQIIMLAYLWGLSRKEIASRLGISEGAAKVKLFRCMERARSLIEGQGREAADRAADRTADRTTGRAAGRTTVRGGEQPASERSE